jgi:hypothetical protein
MTATTEDIAYDLVVAAEAQAVWDRARDTLWPEDTRQAVYAAFWALGGALKAHRNLRCGIVPPWFPGMPAGPEGFAMALRMAADEAAEMAGELAELLPADGTTSDHGETPATVRAEGELNNAA